MIHICPLTVKCVLLVLFLGLLTAVSVVLSCKVLSVSGPYKNNFLVLRLAASPHVLVSEGHPQSVSILVYLGSALILHRSVLEGHMFYIGVWVCLQQAFAICFDLCLCIYQC